MVRLTSKGGTRAYRFRLCYNSQMSCQLHREVVLVPCILGLLMIVTSCAVHDATSPSHRKNAEAEEAAYVFFDFQEWAAGIAKKNAEGESPFRPPRGRANVVDRTGFGSPANPKCLDTSDLESGLFLSEDIVSISLDTSSQSPRECRRLLPVEPFITPLSRLGQNAHETEVREAQQDVGNFMTNLMLGNGVTYYRYVFLRQERVQQTSASPQHQIVGYDNWPDEHATCFLEVELPRHWQNPPKRDEYETMFFFLHAPGKLAPWMDVILAVNYSLSPSPMRSCLEHPDVNIHTANLFLASRTEVEWRDIYTVGTWMHGRVPLSDDGNEATSVADTICLTTWLDDAQTWVYREAPRPPQ